MRTHPSENFIIAILLANANKDPDARKTEVFSTLNTLGIPLPDDEYVDALISMLEGKDPSNAAEFRVKDFFSNTRVFKQAFKLASNFKIRRKVELLLMGNTDPNDISAILLKEGIAVNPAVIREFKHYFFDPSHLVSQDDVIWWAQDNDIIQKYTLAAVDPQAAQLAAGIRITLSVNDILNSLMEEAGKTALELKAFDGPLETKVKMLRMLATTVGLLDETIRSRPERAADLVKEFTDQIQLKSEFGEVPSYGELVRESGNTEQAEQEH